MRPIPPPAALQPSVTWAKHLGRMLFEHDSVAARATDALMARLTSPDPRVRGWLEIQDQNGWVVPFLTDAGGSISALYRVRFETFLDPAPRVEIVDPPEPVDETTARMFLARQTAAHQTVAHCSKNYNSVVIPGQELERDGWLVYLLAATTEPGVLVAGGHHRFLVSPDGGTVIEHFQFTKACLTIAPPELDSKERVAASIITHLTSATPTELHVFLSLLHRRPVYVGVVEPRAFWRVDGTEIALLATGD